MIILSIYIHVYTVYKRDKVVWSTLWFCHEKLQYSLLQYLTRNRYQIFVYFAAPSAP